MTGILQPAAYVELHLPVLIEKLGAARLSIVPPALAGLIQRALPHPDGIGERWPGLFEHLAVHGAFIRGDPPPLLSRVLLSFRLPACGDVRAVGWTLWRRTADAEIAADGGALPAPRGFGVVFESLPEEARHVIEAMLRG
ncbi:MAG: hypothetical protein AABZ30_09525 [Myxococcota bacterium]